jgi:nucleotide-binding universal stress UspA family protein
VVGITGLEASSGPVCQSGSCDAEGDKMYTRILVPLDGSKIAEGVLPYARMLAENLQIPVELLTVLDVADISKHVHANQLTHFDAVTNDEVLKAEKYLSGVATSFHGESVGCTVEKGATAETILGTAGEDNGTLIAMASHGRSGLRRWLLGSIAEKVLRAANNPLFLIRANEEAATGGKATLDSMMVPLDGSKLAESILPYAVELAKAINLKLRLMRSYNVRGMLFSREDYSGFGAVVTKARDEATSYLDAKVQESKAQGLMEVTSLILEGEPTERIIEAAKEAPNGLIAMCTHGRSGVKRWMLGSVTEKVVRHSGNPVLVVRARAGQG